MDDWRAQAWLTNLWSNFEPLFDSPFVLKTICFAWYFQLQKPNQNVMSPKYLTPMSFMLSIGLNSIHILCKEIATVDEFILTFAFKTIFDIYVFFPHDVLRRSCCCTWMVFPGIGPCFDVGCPGARIEVNGKPPHSPGMEILSHQKHKRIWWFFKEIQLQRSHLKHIESPYHTNSLREMHPIWTPLQFHWGFWISLVSHSESFASKKGCTKKPPKFPASSKWHFDSPNGGHVFSPEKGHRFVSFWAL